jgi:hypothetical protein
MECRHVAGGAHVALLAMCAVGRFPLSRGSLHTQTQRILKAVPTHLKSLSLVTNITFPARAGAAERSDEENHQNYWSNDQIHW